MCKCELPSQNLFCLTTTFYIIPQNVIFFPVGHLLSPTALIHSIPATFLPVKAMLGKRPGSLSRDGDNKEIPSCFFINGLIALLVGNWQYLNSATKSTRYNPENVKTEALLKEWIVEQVSGDALISADCDEDIAKSEGHYRWCELDDFFNDHIIALYNAALVSRNVILLALFAYAVPEDEDEFDLDERCQRAQQDLDDDLFYTPTNTDLMRDIAACMLSVMSPTESYIQIDLLQILLGASPRYVALLKQWSFLPLLESDDKYPPGYKTEKGKKNPVLKPDQGRNPLEGDGLDNVDADGEDGPKEEYAKDDVEDAETTEDEGDEDDDDDDDDDDDENNEGYDYSYKWNFDSTKHDYRLRRNIVQIALQVCDTKCLELFRSYGLDLFKAHFTSLPEYDRSELHFNIFSTCVDTDDITAFNHLLELTGQIETYWSSWSRECSPVLTALRAKAPRMAQLAQAHFPLKLDPVKPTNSSPPIDECENCNVYDLEFVLDTFSHTAKTPIKHFTFPTNRFTAPGGINNYVDNVAATLKTFEGLDDCLNHASISKIFLSQLQSNQIGFLILSKLGVQFSLPPALNLSKLLSSCLTQSFPLATADCTLQWLLHIPLSPPIPRTIIFNVNQTIGFVKAKVSQERSAWTESWNPFYVRSYAGTQLTLEPLDGLMNLSVFGRKDAFVQIHVNPLQYGLLSGNLGLVTTLLTAIIDHDNIDRNNNNITTSSEPIQDWHHNPRTNLNRRLKGPEDYFANAMTPLMLAVASPYTHSPHEELSPILIEWILEAYISSVGNGTEDYYHSFF